MTRNRLLICVLCVLVLTLAGVMTWSGKMFDIGEKEPTVHIDRYDRVLDEYVSLNSYTALGRMNTQYPQQTKLLIEDVLSLGNVDDPAVEQQLRHCYLDSAMQVVLDEVHRQYGDLSDIEEQFREAFDREMEKNPDFRPPHVYAQISCLNQSIVVADTLIGISLDKYLGADFPLYAKFFNEEQRARMRREAIVPDAMGTYLHYLHIRR